MMPSHGWVPRSSPPTAHSSSTMRPITPLVTTASLTATNRSLPHSSSIVGSSTTSYSPPKTRARPASSSAWSSEERKPTRPKLTPITGTPVPRKRVSARSMVPSPPSTTARSTRPSPSPCSEEPCRAASSDGIASSTPAASATRCSRSSAVPIAPGWPCVTTAARATGALADGIVDPAVELGGEVWSWSAHEVEEELAVALRSGKPGVYDAHHLGRPCPRGFRHAPEHLPVHLRVADDALGGLGAAGLELRLHEHQRLPAGRCEGEHGRQRHAHRDERDVADDEVGRERQRAELARVRTLEHGHARVGAQARVELAVADVERDHAASARLQQAVGEAPRGGAHVDAVPAPRVDAERLERVRELLASARDEARRPLDCDRLPLVHLRSRLVVPRDEPGEHHRLGLAARVRQPALDEQHVQPLLGHRGRLDAVPALVEERVVLGGRELVLRRPAAAEALVCEDAFARDEFLPYWAEVWPSGVALARHLELRPLGGLRLLELGCGLGLPSLAAAVGGARVLATDWAEDALELLRENAARNGVRLQTAALRWDDPGPLRGRRFPLVVAADVLYEERNGAQLAALVPRVLEDGGAVLVADPGRRHAPAFLEAMSAAGWRVQTLASPHLPRGGIHVLGRAAGRARGPTRAVTRSARRAGRRSRRARTCPHRPRRAAGAPGRLPRQRARGRPPRRAAARTRRRRARRRRPGRAGRAPPRTRATAPARPRGRR